MAQRTVSIVVEVEGADTAARQVRQMRSALDDFATGGKNGLAQIMRQGREASQAMKEMQQSFGSGQQQKEMLGDLDDFFRHILAGARSTGDIFKNIWKEVGDFFEAALRRMGSAWTANLGGVLSSIPGVGGVLGGGLAGWGIGSALSRSGALGILGTFGGPIGAAVGGLIGLFGGGGGDKKEHDAAIANQGFAQLAQILDDYNHFRREYASAVDAANRIWSQMQSQWVRKESAPSQRVYFDSILRSLQQTEDERNRRRQAMSLLPVPEFQEGGFVGTSRSPAALGLSRGGQLAVLHPGEFVMNSQAVQRLGVSALEGLNRGSGATSGSQISLEPASAATLAEMLKQNPQALEEGLLVVLRRGGPASRALRG